MKRSFLLVAIVVTVIIIFGTTAHADINRTLRIGDRGSDVRELQQFLNSDAATRIALSGVGSPGFESDYFGALTLIAVKKLQTKYAYEVLTPSGLVAPTGVVASYTRALIYRLKNLQSPQTPGSVAPSGKPVITGVSPAVITKNGETVTITGENLSSAVAVLSTGSLQGIPLRVAADGKSATFSFIFPAVEKIRAQLAPYAGTARYQQLLAAFVQNMTGAEVSTVGGSTQVRVILVLKNGSGESGPKSLFVDMQQALAQ